MQLTEAGDRVAHIGQAQHTGYALVRDVRGLGTEWPLFRIDDQGRPQDFGRLTAAYDRGSLVTVTEPTDWLRDEFIDGLFPGVPWFLDDQRPQGFLGRRFALRRSRDLGLPADILRWNDDAVLAALLLYGEDGPGNFILGERALERALQQAPEIISGRTRDRRYDELARAVFAGEPAGSFVEGEQPKFTAVIEGDDGAPRHVIVKFSEPVERNPSGRRWADLLICEHLAGRVLTEHGVDSSATELVWSEGRVCLEVTRFDRIGAHGRLGCVTLAAWSDAHDGERDDWPAATRRMWRAGWLNDDVQEQVRRRWWFGRMIGNTDMHFGNLCFFLGDALPLRLAPSYDMLPMLYRPSGSGAVVAREYVPPPPVPSDMHHWHEAAEWAELFWHRVAEHAEVSIDFRDIAKANADAVSRYRRRFQPT